MAKEKSKSGEPSRLQFFFGTDEYEVSTRARDSVGVLCPDEEQAFGLETIDGAADKVETAVNAVKQCMEALFTVGLFGGKKTVWLKGVTFFTPSQTGSSAEVKEWVKKLAAALKKGFPDGHTLVISAAKIHKQSTIYKACKELGVLNEFNVAEKSYQAEKDAGERARAFFKSAGVAIDPSALEAFLQRTGPDARTIMQEGDKLLTYVGAERQVRVEDVKAIVSPGREALAWDLTEAVGARKIDDALTALDRLIGQKESEIGLIIALQNHLRQLQIFRSCLDQGWVRPGRGGANWVDGPAADVHLGALESDPRKMHSFRAGKLLEQAQRFSGREIRRLRARALETQEKMVSSAVPARLLMDFLIVEAARFAKG